MACGQESEISMFIFSIFQFLPHSILQTSNEVNSKVMDDYCWIHSTFHVRSEYQGNVGCILDNVLAGRDSILLAAADTPDTAFYQWVPFTLVFQVSYSLHLLSLIPLSCWPLQL